MNFQEIVEKARRISQRIKPSRKFQAHMAFIPPTKLRFLQYVTKDTRPWWEARRDQGAVLL